MTPAQLIAWRNKNDYSQAQLAEVLAVDVMTISRWERDVRRIPPFLHLALECMEMKGGELGKGLRNNKPGEYPQFDEPIMIIREKGSSVAAHRATKKKTKRR